MAGLISGVYDPGVTGMIKINFEITPQTLVPKLENLFEYAGQKIRLIKKKWNPEQGTPVFTINGKYTSRGWTEWTQGFQFGCAILQHDATGEKRFLEFGRENTFKHMSPHVSHTGVHDHGFNNISTYGNLLRLMLEDQIQENEMEKSYYEMALKISGAVQAARWTQLPGGLGYIYSFNGPHSLFSDTIRSIRSLAISHQLGQVLMGEQDSKINLFERGLQHAETTARYNVYFGHGRDAYDLRGRVVHESIFNIKSGEYRCPSSQQGYSPFSTWTRGLAWILLGYPELLEYIETLEENEFQGIANEIYDGKAAVIKRFTEVAEAVADFYLKNTPVDGIPYWDTGAPGLGRLGNYLDNPADPFNEHEPVDSSAAAIAAQGLIRLGNFLIKLGQQNKGRKYFQAGLTVANQLFEAPYLSTDSNHQGLILHAVYHRPNGWDYIPPGKRVPCGESCMWGDFHAMELGILLLRMAKGRPYYKFFL
jgi:hypothetical protein